AGRRWVRGASRCQRVCCSQNTHALIAEDCEYLDVSAEGLDEFANLFEPCNAPSTGRLELRRFLVRDGGKTVEVFLRDAQRRLKLLKRPDFFVYGRRDLS